MRRAAGLDVQWQAALPTDGDTIRYRTPVMTTRVLRSAFSELNGVMGLCTMVRFCWTLDFKLQGKT
jgi:hypothetical protein